MSDLDTIAVNDMKHDLCDLSPCLGCSTHCVCWGEGIVFYGTLEMCQDYLNSISKYSVTDISLRTI